MPREVVSQGQRRAIELFQSGDLAMAATGAEFLRSIQVNAPGIAAATGTRTPPDRPRWQANVALMTLAVPKQSARAQEALDLALFLTNGANQTRFAEQARVLPSSLEALAAVRSSLEREQPTTEQEQQIRQARLLSAQTLEQARVLVPALPRSSVCKASSTPSCSERCWGSWTAIRHWRPPMNGTAIPRLAGRNGSRRFLRESVKRARAKRFRLGMSGLNGMVSTR